MSWPAEFRHKAALDDETRSKCDAFKPINKLSQIKYRDTGDRIG